MDNVAKVYVLTPGKEYVKLVKANKNSLCHECGRPIFKGEKYISDHINYVVRSRYDKVFLKWYVNKICLRCWCNPEK